MKALSVIGLSCVVMLSVVTVQAAEEAKIRYYKAGEVGAFEITVQLPSKVDPTKTGVVARPASDNVYLLYSRLPQFEQLARRNRGPKLTHEEQKRIAALEQQNQALWEKIYKNSEWQLSSQVSNLEEIIKQEREKKKGRDEELVKNAEHTLRKLKEKLTAIQIENKKRRLAITVNDKEIEKIRQGAESREKKSDGPMLFNVYGRFQGAGKAGVELVRISNKEIPSKPDVICKVDLNLPEKDGGDKEVLQQWAEQQVACYYWYCLMSPVSSYYQYCMLQTIEKYSLKDSQYASIISEEMGAGRPDLYAMTTGALAIQESLQLEAMTGKKPIDADRSVALDSLKGPEIKSHPYEKMLEGREPKIFKSADLVPYDSYYCRFSSISKMISVTDLMKEWGASLLRMLTVSARDSELPQKCQKQLCIGVSRLTRLFGDMVIGDVTITGSDPFMFEGTDFSVLIHVRNRAVFDKQMAGYISDALQANPDVERKEVDHGGVKILCVTTPDRRIASFSAYLGDFKVYSNSLDAMKRILDTGAGQYKSMASNADFRYMRTIFPGTKQDEDGFLYLSDAMIRKLVGPRWKIYAQRRIVCQNHLRMAGNAAAMYRSENRRTADLKTLVKERYMKDKLLVCPDGGTYSLDKTGRASCTVHNCLRYCTPVDSIPVGNVSKRESGEYETFVKNYNDYWSKFFDPIGIRFRVRKTGVEAETCILPLIENSIYNQLTSIVGGAPVPLKSRILTDKTILSATAKIDLSRSGFRRMVDGIQEDLFPMTPSVTRAVGNSVSINLCDGDVLFTVSETGLGGMGFMDLKEQLIISTILSAINLPMYGVVELKDEKLARTIVDQLVRHWSVRSRQERGRMMFDGFSVEHYKSAKYKQHEVHALGIKLFVIHFRLHYSIAAGRLIVSTKRNVLEDVLDALDRETEIKTKPITANVHVDIRPRAYDKLAVVATMGWQERIRRACLNNIVPIRELMDCHGATPETLSAVARRIHGEVPRCPAGGEYRFDPGTRLYYCTVHGHNYMPKQPLAPSGDEGIIRLLRKLRDISVTFRFTKEGIMTRVALDMEAPKAP